MHALFSILSKLTSSELGHFLFIGFVFRGGSINSFFSTRTPSINFQQTWLYSMKINIYQSSTVISHLKCRNSTKPYICNTESLFSSSFYDELLLNIFDPFQYSKRSHQNKSGEDPLLSKEPAIRRILSKKTGKDPF